MKSVTLYDEDLRKASGQTPEQWAKTKQQMVAKMGDWRLQSDGK
jgi:hypothetical protein